MCGRYVVKNPVTKTSKLVKSAICKGSRLAQGAAKPTGRLPESSEHREKSQNIVVDATAANGAIVKYETPEVKDEGGISYGPVCEPKSGNFFPIGSTTVTCIAKDTANNQGATAFTVTVKSKIAAPTIVPTTVSVNVGKPFYQNDEAIFITGAANPIINEKVNLEIRDPLSNLVGIEQADVEEFGSYTAIVFPSSLWNVNGTYSTSASYGTSIDATFDAGNCAALQRTEKLSESYPSSPDPGKDVKSTWNRLGRAPPPIKVDLIFSIECGIC